MFLTVFNKLQLQEYLGLGSGYKMPALPVLGWLPEVPQKYVK